MLDRILSWIADWIRVWATTTSTAKRTIRCNYLVIRKLGGGVLRNPAITILSAIPNKIESGWGGRRWCSVSYPVE